MNFSSVAAILYVLALGSPIHAISEAAWPARIANYKWDRLYGKAFINYAPLFIHQYSHIWIDFRGIQDAYTRQKGIDYFENSRRATYAQRAYAIDNPGRFRDYGANVWAQAWFEENYLGIDQGPIVLMAENYRSGLVWKVMKSNSYIERGLCRAGFAGGWIEGKCGSSPLSRRR